MLTVSLHEAETVAVRLLLLPPLDACLLQWSW